MLFRAKLLRTLFASSLLIMAAAGCKKDDVNAKIKTVPIPIPTAASTPSVVGSQTDADKPARDGLGELAIETAAPSGRASR